MKQLPLLLVALVSIALGAWLGLQSPGDDEDPYAHLGGDFTLQSDKGPVSLSDFRGKVVALYFGYTRCPDVCITALTKVSQAMRALDEKEREQIQPIFVSIDPERDTPQIASEYARYFYPGAVGLSGSPEEIAKVAKRYLVIYEKVPMKDSAMGYSMDHSSIIYVIGRDGKIHSLVHHADTAEALAQYLREALADKPSKNPA